MSSTTTAAADVDVASEAAFEENFELSNVRKRPRQKHVGKDYEAVVDWNFPSRKGRKPYQNQDTIRGKTEIECKNGINNCYRC